MPDIQQTDKPERATEEAKRAIRALLGDRPIAYHAVLGRALGSASAGILLSQLWYWSPYGADPDGWIWKTREDIYDETALSRYEQESARAALRTAKVIEEKVKG